MCACTKLLFCWALTRDCCYTRSFLPLLLTPLHCPPPRPPPPPHYILPVHTPCPHVFALSAFPHCQAALPLVGTLPAEPLLRCPLYLNILKQVRCSWHASQKVVICTSPKGIKSSVRKTRALRISACVYRSDCAVCACVKPSVFLLTATGRARLDGGHVSSLHV